MKAAVMIVLAILLCAAGCGNPAETGPAEGNREDSIPEGTVKVTPETDLFPPVLHSSDWAEPVPLSSVINTAGVEDAPVISPDGNTLYFFFTPDVSAPAEEQLTDGYTGIWLSHRSGAFFGEAERVVLCNDVSLDGPMALVGDTLWFASIRQNTYGTDGDMYLGWQNAGEWSWANAGEQLNGDYNIGECAVSSDGTFMISARVADYGGYGGYDLWRLDREAEGFSEPENLGELINSPYDDGWPTLSPDGSELWFTSSSREGYPGPAVFRSQWNGSGWSSPQEIVSSFTGDPAVDTAGNLWFTHVYADSAGGIIETDIYVCMRR